MTAAEKRAAAASTAESIDSQLRMVAAAAAAAAEAQAHAEALRQRHETALARAQAQQLLLQQQQAALGERTDAEGAGAQLYMHAAAPAPAPADFGVDDLFGVFNAFAQFGARSGGSSGGGSSSEPELDGKGFAKLCRESGVSREPGVTAASIDIGFTKAAKARSRTARTVDFAGFQAALGHISQDLCAQTGRDFEEAFGHVLALASSCPGPLAHGTFADVRGSVYDKLTDVRGYTGAHRFRFSEDGRGIPTTAKG
jgi:multidrug efflux pump subunit AcrA (membrane-fusion protein)